MACRRDAVEGLKWATLANHKRTRETMLAVMTGAEIAEARRRAREWEARRRLPPPPSHARAASAIAAVRVPE